MVYSLVPVALVCMCIVSAGLFIGRIDYQDLQLRRKEKRAEFVWDASPSLGKDAQVRERRECPDATDYTSTYVHCPS